MDNLYSRQIGTIGKKSMNKLLNLKVLVIGCGATGMECVKCLTLLGINTVYLMDNRKITNKYRGRLYHYNKSKGILSQNLKDFVYKLNPSMDCVTINEPVYENILNLINNNIVHAVIITDQFIKNVIQIEKLCMENKIKFLLGFNVELYAYIFANFGQDHLVYDTDGEIYENTYIQNVEITDDKYIFCEVEKMNKNLTSNNGYLINSEKEKLGVKIVKSTLVSITLENSVKLKNFLEKSKNIRFVETKIEKKISHKPLLECIEKFNYSLIETNSSFNRNDMLYKLIINKILRKDQNIEHNINPNEFNKIKEIINGDIKFFILESIIGSILAHEVIKITGKYLPLNQELLFDFSALRGGDICVRNNEFYDITSTLDRKILKKIKQQNIFMIGSGALGCELSKNLGMLQFCSNKKSHLSITDMDTIELSNLNRQFLFRSDNLGDYKSSVIQKRLKEYTPKMNVNSYNLEVGEVNKDTFNSKFWNNHNLVINALDNLEARKYVDSKCVLHSKALFESGTLGCKANTQIIIPNKTATYSELTDIEDKSIPMCTIRNFPNKFEHCIEWGLEIFDKLFNESIKNLKLFLVDKDKLKKELLSLDNSIVLKEKLEYLLHLLELLNSKSFDSFLVYARSIYDSLYIKPIKDILYSFPDNLIDKYGNQFWSGNRLKPELLEYNKVSDSFTKSLFNTIKKILCLSYEFNDDKYQKYINNFKANNYKLNKIKLDLEKDSSELEMNHNQELEIEKLWLDYDKYNINFNHNNLTILKYDKDIDIDVNIMSILSNLRAKIYTIEQKDNLEVKLLSGRIIPALSTTTTLISGFVIIEILKYFSNLKSCDININLALNDYILFESLKPKTFFNNMFSNIYNMNVKTIPDYFNTWHQIKIDAKKDMCSRLSSLIDILKSDYKIDPFMITLKNDIIYNKLNKFNDDYLDDIFTNLNYNKDDYLDLNVSSFDSNGLPILIPPVILTL